MLIHIKSITLSYHNKIVTICDEMHKFSGSNSKKGTKPGLLKTTQPVWCSIFPSAWRTDGSQIAYQRKAHLSLQNRYISTISKKDDSINTLQNQVSLLRSRVNTLNEENQTLKTEISSLNRLLTAGSRPNALKSPSLKLEKEFQIEAFKKILSSFSKW